MDVLVADRGVGVRDVRVPGEVLARPGPEGRVARAGDQRPGEDREVLGDALVMGGETCADPAGITSR